MHKNKEWPDRPLNRKEAANYLQDVHGYKMSAATLCSLATRGGGPTYVAMGRWIRYLKDDLDAWITRRTSQRVNSTSELRGGM